MGLNSCFACAMLTISPNFKYSMFVQERISCKICHIKKKVDVNLPVIPYSHHVLYLCKQNILRPYMLMLPMRFDQVWAQKNISNPAMFPEEEEWDSKQIKFR